MNILAALAMLMSGIDVKRTRWDAEKNYTVTEKPEYVKTACLSYSKEAGGITHNLTESVYGRERLRIRPVHLSSEDILAEDWAVAPKFESQGPRDGVFPREETSAKTYYLIEKNSIRKTAYAFRPGKPGFEALIEEISEIHGLNWRENYTLAEAL